MAYQQATNWESPDCSYFAIEIRKETKMPYSRMSAEKMESLFGAGVITLGPKKRGQTGEKFREPLLTPEQDAQLGELIKEQGRLPTHELVGSEPPAPNRVRKFKELITSKFLNLWPSSDGID